MKRPAGFTLIEVLLAIVLASLVLTSIYGIFTATSRAKETVEKRGAALHLGRVLIARLDRELLGLSLTNQGKIPALQGGENELGEPFIALLTNSSASPNVGLRYVRYRLGNDQEDIMTLWRSEMSAHSSQRGAEENLSRGISSLVFEFYDGSSWQDHWDSSNGQQPVLVRATIKLKDAEEIPALVGTFALPLKGKTL